MKNTNWMMAICAGAMTFASTAVFAQEQTQNEPPRKPQMQNGERHQQRGPWGERGNQAQFDKRTLPAGPVMNLSPEARQKIAEIMKSEKARQDAEQKERMADRRQMKELLDAYKADKSEANKARILAKLGEQFDKRIQKQEERLAAQNKALAEKKAGKDKAVQEQLARILEAGDKPEFKHDGKRGQGKGMGMMRNGQGKGMGMMRGRKGPAGPDGEKSCPMAPEAKDK